MSLPNLSSPRFLSRCLPLLLLTAAGPLRAADLGFDPAQIEAITGLKGTKIESEGVFKVTSPRKDVPVVVDGWRMPPFMGLTSWASFEGGGKKDAMVMGDLVLFGDEVNPVMSALLDHGLQVTAVHNHFSFDEPRVYFMHIGGEGSAESLAKAVRAAFDAVARIRAARPEPTPGFGGEPLPAVSALSPAPVEAVLGAKAQRNSGMLKFVFGRQVTMDCGCPAGQEMGVNTWAALAGTDDNALVDGDFVATGPELQVVLKTLRAGGINIVAIHHHMIGETPRTIFLHYWGRGRAADLAAVLKRALVAQAAIPAAKE
jgi:Domain of Unknown Function (DUF1259)